MHGHWIYTPFLIANRHLLSSDRQIALVSSAGIPFRQRSPHIDIVHLYKARGIENRHSAPRWHWSHNLGYWISMLKLNAPAEIHWRRSNMNTRDPILMKSVEVLKDCRSLNAADEMNCPMPRSVEKVPVRNEKRCSLRHVFCRLYIFISVCCSDGGWAPKSWNRSPTSDEKRAQVMFVCMYVPMYVCRVNCPCPEQGRTGPNRAEIRTVNFQV